MKSTASTQMGSALTWSGLVVITDLFVILLMQTRHSRTDALLSRPPIAAWRRATPWMLTVSAATSTLGLGMLWFADG